MRKAKRWDKLIPEVNGKYGAPMGRATIGERPQDGTIVFDAKVPMCTCCGAYDEGGAYWGSNINKDIGELRVKFTQDKKYVEFYRSKPKMWHLHNQDKIDYFTIINPQEFWGVVEITTASQALKLIDEGVVIDERAEPVINNYFKTKILPS